MNILDVNLGRKEKTGEKEWDAIEKSLINAESIEKSRKGKRRANHKYIRVFTKADGKDEYLYKEDMLTPFNHSCVSLASVMKEYIGRKMTKKPDGTTVMTWEDGRIIHTDRKGNVIYDNAETTQPKAEKDLSPAENATVAPTESAVENTSNTGARLVNVPVQIKERKVYSRGRPSTVTGYTELHINGNKVSSFKDYESGWYDMTEDDRNIINSLPNVPGMDFKETETVDKDLKGTKEEIIKQIENIGYDNSKLEKDFINCINNIEDGGNNGGGGNEPPKNNKKRFTDLTDAEKRQKKEQIENNVIANVKNKIITKTEDKSASRVAQEWVENNIKEPAQTEIGDIAITKRTIKDSLSHGFSQDKLDSITIIKDVLERGTYLGYERDHNEATVDNHYFAAKVYFEDGEKIVFCRVHDAEGDDINRFYVHEVFTEDDIKKESSLQSSSAEISKKSGRPLYLHILHDILNVNSDTKNLSEAMKGNHNARKPFTVDDFTVDTKNLIAATKTTDEYIQSMLTIE